MIRIGMSTSRVYPQSTEHAFVLAKAAGFDGIEVMVIHDPTTQDADGLLELSRRFELPIMSIHAPVLPFTQLVWGIGANHKLERRDGPGSMGEGYLFDEHRLPGHGTQPVAEVLQYLAGRGWNGSIIAEVNTRNAGSERERLGMLVETRAFAQQHLASPRPVLPKRAKSDSA